MEQEIVHHRWVTIEGKSQLIAETESERMARFKKIKITPRQLSFLKNIKKYSERGFVDKTDFIRGLPRDVSRKLFAHGLIELELKVTDDGDKWIFIEQMKNIG